MTNLQLMPHPNFGHRSGLVVDRLDRTVGGWRSCGRDRRAGSGEVRAAQLPWFKRILLIVVSPLLPFVFLRKILAAVVRLPRYRWQIPRALPWLLFFLFGWGLGEARGYLESIARR